MGIRDESRARTTNAIVEAARREIAERGGGGLSMRAIAREVGLVSSAVYRYFPTREALITAMVIESYSHLDTALANASAHGSPAQRWTTLAAALRAWALDVPHEFQLIYGTPIPGYVAPPETIPAAGAVAEHFLAVGAAGPVTGFTGAALLAQMTELTAHGADPSGAAAVIAEVAALIGFLTLELGGHLVGTADPAEPLFTALVARQVASLGLSSATP